MRVGKAGWTAHDGVEGILSDWIEQHRDDVIDAAARLIRIESVEGPPAPGKPFGDGVAEALAFVGELANRLGLETLNVGNYAMHAEWRPGGAEGGARCVGVLTHVDVVPAGTGWSLPPFGGVVRDGRLYGRGAIDNKGPTVASLFAVASLAATGVPLRRAVRLIVGGDEETGFECVRHYFRHHPYPEVAFSPDAVFPLVFAEKGILDVTLAGAMPPSSLERLVGGERPNVVPDRAEAVVRDADSQNARWADRIQAAARGRRARIEVEPSGEGRLVARAHGVATHGSTPEKGINAAGELLACLVEADGGSGRLDPNGALAFLAQAAAGLRGEGLGIVERDDVSGTASCNLGVVRLERGSVRATFNVRYPVAIPSAAPLVERVRSRAYAAGLVVEQVRDDPPHHVPEESPLVQTLLDVYRRQTGDRETPPLAIGGGTYARAIPHAVAFGPVMPFSGVVPHEKDEHIEIDHLVRITRIYAAALCALAR